MNTAFARLNAIFAFSLTTLAVLTIVFSLSSYFRAYGELAEVDFKVVRNNVRRMQDYHTGLENDLAFLQFDFDADFSKCFDWNVKQLFIYLTANYKTVDNVVNQIVIWDHILQRGQNGIFSLKKSNTKYYIWDDGFGLRGNKNVSLTLNLNVVPNAGALKDFASPSTYSFALPDDYTHN